MTNPIAFTPDELADRLDALLINPQQLVDDPLLQVASRLINVPMPALSPAAFERIQQQLLSAAAQPPSLQTRLMQSPMLLIGLVIVVIILVIVLIFSAQQNQAAGLPATNLPEPTIAMTEIPRATTDNPVFSATLTPPDTATPTATVTPVATITPTASITPLPPIVTPASSMTPLPPIVTPASSITSLPPIVTPTASITPLPPIVTPASSTPIIPTSTMTRSVASATPLPTLANTFTPIPATNSPVAPTSTMANPVVAQAEPSDLPTATRTAAPLTTLVIEGKITAINVNQIVIFGMTITLDPSSPLLASLRVGDEVRIEAVVVTSGTLIIMSAINVEVTSVEVFINEATGAVFRDDNDCSNPPPAWAPANGWRARCEGGAAPGNSGNAPGNSGNNPGNSGGMGMGDDD